MQRWAPSHSWSILLSLFAAAAAILVIIPAPSRWRVRRLRSAPQQRIDALTAERGTQDLAAHFLAGANLGWATSPLAEFPSQTDEC